MTDKLTQADTNSGRRRFRPPLVPTLVAALMLAALLGLGTWQARRYFEATETLASYHAQHDALPPVDELASFTSPDRADKLHFRRVALKGRLVVSEAQIVTAIYKFARPGLGVLMPLQVEGASPPKVMVYLGWVPEDRLASYLDAVKANPEVTIHGRIQKPGYSTAKIEPIGEILGYVKWRSPDISGILAHLSTTVEGLDATLFIRSGKEAVGDPIDLEKLPLDGYRNPLSLPPAKHVEYAITWYGIAASLIAVWIALSLRREDEGADEAPRA